VRDRPTRSCASSTYASTPHYSESLLRFTLDLVCPPSTARFNGPDVSTLLNLGYDPILDFAFRVPLVRFRIVRSLNARPSLSGSGEWARAEHFTTLTGLDRFLECLLGLEVWTDVHGFLPYLFVGLILPTITS
jgi:hypothetical protein